MEDSIIKTINIKENSFWGTISLFLLVFIAMLKNELPDILTKLIPIVSLLIAFFASQNNKLPKQPFKYDSFFILFLAWWTIGVLYTPDTSRALGLVTSSIVAYIICYLLYRFKINYNIILGFFSIACALSSLTVILQLLYPIEIENIRYIFMNTSNSFYDVGESWLKNNWYTGIFADRATGAFYGSMSICMGVVYYYFNRYNEKIHFASIISLSLIIVGVWAIFLTAKRGLFVGSFFASLFCIWVKMKAQKRPVLKIILTLTILVVIIGFITFNIDVTQTLLERFTDNEDVLTNRGDIWNRLIAVARDNLIIGVGTCSANTYLHVGGHNIYMTLLMENGIIGVVLFLIPFIILIRLTYKVLKDSMNFKVYENIPYLVMSLYIQFFFFVYGMSGNPLYDNYIFYVYLMSVLLTKMAAYRINQIKKTCGR